MENLVILYVIISYIIVCGYSVANINDDNNSLDDLSYNEIRAVGLHEVGHRVLNHYQKQDKFLKNWNFDRNELKNFRYNNEFTADLFATLYFKQTKQKNYLPEALLKLTAPDKINISTSSHPSTRIRIEKINQIEKEIY